MGWIARPSGIGSFGIIRMDYRVGKQPSAGSPFETDRGTKARVGRVGRGGAGWEKQGRAVVARRFTGPVEQDFGLTLHERTVGKLLDALGYRRLSVRPFNPKTDPVAQEVFKKTSPPT